MGNVPKESKDTRDPTDGQDLVLDDTLPLSGFRRSLFGICRAFLLFLQLLLCADVEKGQQHVRD